MKKLPFSPHMVEANDRGLKTRTRRKILQPTIQGTSNGGYWTWIDPKRPDLRLLASLVGRNQLHYADTLTPKAARLFKYLKPGDLVYEARQFVSQKTGKNTAGMYMGEVAASRCLQVTHLWLERLGTNPEDAYANEGIAVLPYYDEMKAAGATGQEIYARLWDSLNTDPALRFENQPWALCIEYAVYATKEAGSSVWQRVDGGECFAVKETAKSGNLK